MRGSFATTVFVVLFITGCSDSQKIASLQKEVKDLQEQAKIASAATQYDIGEKCATDARKWFDANWPSDKNTILLTYENHYNKAGNACFISVEYHSKLYTSSESWSNEISLWNVNENAKQGDFAETHQINTKSGGDPLTTMVSCSVGETKCGSLDEYRKLVAPYMTN